MYKRIDVKFIKTSGNYRNAGRFKGQNVKHQ